MMKYQKIILASVILLIVVGITDYFIRINFWFYIGIILVTTGLLAYGSASIRSDFYCRVLFPVKTDDKVIALTFDDGPDKVVTPVILDILKENNIKALFFCIGEKVTENREIIKRIDTEGHIIGNHSFTHHFFFDLFRKEKMQSELEMCDNIIRSILNRKIKLFRPPYGVINPALASVIKRKGYYVIGWSLKSKDTVIKDDELLFMRLVKKLSKSNILLFHDTMKVTTLVLDKYIKFAKEKNYRFERADHLLNIEPYE
jgi:peptidoglycan/xylan/chitin deacetylase (PgdA/CDA1 family)